MSGTEISTVEQIGQLPATSDTSQWSEGQKALLGAIGLVTVVKGQTITADRGTIEVFLAQCKRTQLDPVARQIYCIYRGGKWGTQISIDGARLVAERSRKYQGQTATEWCGPDGVWRDVWLEREYPVAARVGVYRKGWKEPLYAVANWDAYVQGFSKNGAVEVSKMWAKMGPLMLAKCAEMLALRKAFPQDLSGLYSAEEMSQADAPEAVEAVAESKPKRAAASKPVAPRRPPAGQAEQPVAPRAEDVVRGDDGGVPIASAPVMASADVLEAVASVTTIEHLRKVWELSESQGALGHLVDAEGHTLAQLITRRKDQIDAEEAAAVQAEAAAEPGEEVVEGEVMDEAPAAS